MVVGIGGVCTYFLSKSTSVNSFQSFQFYVTYQSKISAKSSSPRIICSDLSQFLNYL